MIVGAECESGRSGSAAHPITQLAWRDSSASVRAASVRPVSTGSGGSPPAVRCRWKLRPRWIHPIIVKASSALVPAPYKRRAGRASPLRPRGGGAHGVGGGALRTKVAGERVDAW